MRTHRKHKQDLYLKGELEWLKMQN
jgi:hypothetical protein